MKRKHLKYFFGIGIMIGFLSVNILTTEAHTLLIDGSIGAVLHIDPDDDPIARDPAIFSFDFKDTEGKLDLKKCDCTASISSNGSPLYSTVINSDKDVVVTSNNLQFAFTPPAKGIYTVVVEGKAFDESYDFQSFKLSDDIRVDKESVGSAASPSALGRFLGGHTIHYILFGGAILFSIFLVIRDKRKEKKV